MAKQISIAFYAAAAAVVAGGWVYFTGTPIPAEATQTGYRGTGMETIADARDLTALSAANVLPEPQTYDPEPVVPEPGEELVKDIDFYENVQVLGDLTEANFNRLMAAITEWVAPEQGCAYCHGEEGNFASDDNYAKVVSRRMLQMTRHINANWGDHVGAVGVTCYTCHRGQNVPKGIWFEDEHPRAGMSAGADRANQNRPLAITAYSSLPAAALETYLSGEESPSIRVISLQPRRGDAPTPGVKETEATYSLMMYLSSSLGVNCTFCHNSRSFFIWEASPPTRMTAWHGIQMVRGLNAEYLTPLGPEYPPHRLGPTGDAPKLACTTCHQGAPKPLLGQSMLGDWPELATEGAPVYE